MLLVEMDENTTLTDTTPEPPGKRFKIAIVGGCLSSHGGGAPRSMAQQGRALVDADNEVTFFSGTNKKYPFTPEELQIEHIPCCTSRLWGPSVLGLFPGAMIRLWRTAPELDVIHLNGAWNLTTYLCGRIAQWRKTPYIISCRSHYGNYHFSRMPLLKKILFQLLEKTNIKDAYALHVTADWEEKTSWRAVQHAKCIIKIPNPVNLNDFQDPPSREASRKHLGLDPNGFYIVHLGRLGKQKNLSFLMRAFHAADLGSKAHLVFVGPPEHKEKDAMHKLSQELGIEKQVAFIQFAKGRERCYWLAAANLFALPSHDENFCIAAIEAVASGTHCLLSPNIGATEYLPEKMVDVRDFNPNLWAFELQKEAQNPSAQLISEKELFHCLSKEQIIKQWLENYAFLKSYPTEETSNDNEPLAI